MEQNPCLLLDWKDLWKMLGSAGWTKTEKGVYEYPLASELLGSARIVPGVHRFYSVAGLKCYIDRYDNMADHLFSLDLNSDFPICCKRTISSSRR